MGQSPASSRGSAATVQTIAATVSTDPNTYIGTHVFDLGHATVYTATLTLTAFSGDGETLGGTPGDIQLSIGHEMSFDGTTYVNGLANVAGGAAYPDNTFVAVSDPGYYAGPTMRYLRFQVQWEDSNFDPYVGPNNPVGTASISVAYL